MTDHSDLIARLRAAIDLGDRTGARGRRPENIYNVADEALIALSSESLSLSEAREEIERLKGDIAVKAKLLTKSAKETRAFWDALVPKSGRCRDCADFDGRCQGDGPPCDPQAHALENLAKLQAASPDLSSLRKGAEVAVKPLEWLSHAWGCEADGGRYRIEDNGPNWTDDRYWLFVNVGLLTNHRSKYDTLESAKSAAQSDFETRIRAALVSGSREDGE